MEVNGLFPLVPHKVCQVLGDVLSVFFFIHAHALHESGVFLEPKGQAKGFADSEANNIEDIQGANRDRRQPRIERMAYPWEAGE